MIVLDTNVISELLRPQPAPHVEAWLSDQECAKLYFTTVGEAELRHGVALCLRENNAAHCLQRSRTFSMKTSLTAYSLSIAQQPALTLSLPQSGELQEDRSVNSAARLLRLPESIRPPWPLETRMILVDAGSPSLTPGLWRHRLKTRSLNLVRKRQLANYRPPATSSIVPVTYDDCSDISHSAASATSSAVPPRCIGTPTFARSTRPGSPALA